MTVNDNRAYIWPAVDLLKLMVSSHGDVGPTIINTYGGAIFVEMLSSASAASTNADEVVRQLRHYFEPFSHHVQVVGGGRGSWRTILPTHTRRVTCSTQRPCLFDADWCLQSDAMPDSGAERDRRGAARRARRGPDVRQQ